MKKYYIFILCLMSWACTNNSFSNYSIEERCIKGLPVRRSCYELMSIDRQKWEECHKEWNDFVDLAEKLQNKQYYECIKTEIAGQNLVSDDEKSTLLRLAFVFRDFTTISSQLNQIHEPVLYTLVEGFKQSKLTIGDIRPFVPESNKQLLLGFAIVTENITEVRNLLSEGVSVHKLIGKEYPINIAAKTGNVDIIKILLDHHADPTVRSRMFPEYPLISAVIRGHLPAVKLILSQPQVDVDSSPFLASGIRTGVTSLMYAIDDNNLEMVKLLLDYHANPNNIGLRFSSSGRPVIQQYTIGGYHLEGETPLSIAIKHSNLQMIKLLVRYGANVNREYTLFGPQMNESSYYRRQRRETPLDLAYEVGNDEIINFLLKKGAKTSDQ